MRISSIQPRPPPPPAILTVHAKKMKVPIMSRSGLVGQSLSIKYSYLYPTESKNEFLMHENWFSHVDVTTHNVAPSLSSVIVTEHV